MRTQARFGKDSWRVVFQQAMEKSAEIDNVVVVHLEDEDVLAAWVVYTSRTWDERQAKYTGQYYVRDIGSESAGQLTKGATIGEVLEGLRTAYPGFDELDAEHLGPEDWLPVTTLWGWNELCRWAMYHVGIEELLFRYHPEA